MKKIILFLLPALSLFADYAGLAKEIESTSKNPEIRKIAVLPFEVISGSYAKGAEVQDELIFAFVRNTSFTVLERSQVDKAIAELELSSTGLMDQQTSQKIGLGIGAQGLIMGTVTQIPGGYKINARLVETQTFTVLAVATTEIAPSTPSQTNTSSTIPSIHHSSNLEILGGYSFTNINLRAGDVYTTYPPVPLEDLGLSSTDIVESVELDNVQHKPVVPVAIRWRTFTNGLGLGMEFMTRSHATMAQTADLYINKAKTGTEDLPDNYIQFDLYEFNISLLGAKRWAFYELYGGASMGVGIATLTSSHIFINDPYNTVTPKHAAAGETAVSLGGALILGNTFYIGDNFGILIEGRYTGLFAEWDRDGEAPPGIDEDMVLTLNGPMVLSGVSLRWE